MTTDREAAEVIRSWMKEETELNDAGLHRVLARIPDTLQRRHRWLWPFDWHPFAGGATRSAEARKATPPWRFSEMLSATRVAAAVAVLALTGTFALVAGPLGPPGEPVAPAAETPASAMPASHFSGTADWGLREAGVQDGEYVRGTVGTLWLLEGFDPRITGMAEMTLDFHDVGGMDTVSGTLRLTNADGGWKGPMTGFGTESEIWLSGWLSGDGAHAGLSQYLQIHYDDQWPAQVDGIIYEGPPPSDGATFD